MLDELVHQLANLETGWRGALQESDAATAGIDRELDKLHAKIDELMEERAKIQAPYVTRTDELGAEIWDTKAEILSAWNGEKKTLQGDGWVLKFRTTKSLEINDGGSLMSDIMKHFGPHIIADEFISGFNKTKVKKFIDLHPQPPDVVELIEKTSVKLEVVG